MKIKPEFVTSIFSIFAPICLIVTMCIIEQEFVEAIWCGLLIGWGFISFWDRLSG